MYANKKKSPRKNRHPSAYIPFEVSGDIDTSIRNNQSGNGNDFVEYQDIRHERSTRRRQINCKTPPQTNKSRNGSVSSGNSTSPVNSNVEFPVFSREQLGEEAEFYQEFDTLESLNENVESFDSIHWPALKSATKCKKPDQNLSSQKLVDVGIQTEKYCIEVKYPLWNTKEIVLPVEDDVPIYARNLVFRGTQTESYMFIKRDATRNEIFEEISTVSPSSPPNHKTYADVVQQETTKLDQGFRSVDTVSVTEMKTFFKIKDSRRNEIPELSQQFQHQSNKVNSENLNSEKQNSSVDRGTESMSKLSNSENPKENEATSCFKELLQCFTELKEKISEINATAIEAETLTCSKVNGDNDYAYQEIGDGDSILKTTNEFPQTETEVSGTSEEYLNNVLDTQNPPFYSENLQSCYQDPYYNYEQILFRAKAEIIALEDFEPVMAYAFKHGLWAKGKPRLSYTRMFSKSSDSNPVHESETNSESCQHNEDTIPKWIQLVHQSGYQLLSDCTIERQYAPTIYETERRISSRYLFEMQVSEIHQHVTPVIELPGQPLYSNSWRCPYVQSENNALEFSQRS